MSVVYDCARSPDREDGLAAAAGAVRAGSVVVMPTDTVYGVGVDAFSSSGVRALLAAKNRGPDMPIGVMVGSWTTVDGLVLSVPRSARQLIEAFWPGDLSILLPHAPSLSWDIGQSGGTVMLRMPLHPVALELLREVGPMAVSSANRAGSAPTTTVQDARDQLGESVSVYLDGGEQHAALSTVIDLTSEDVVVLREGAVTEKMIQDVLAQN